MHINAEKLQNVEAFLHFLVSNYQNARYLKLALIVNQTR